MLCFKCNCGWIGEKLSPVFINIPACSEGNTLLSLLLHLLFLLYFQGLWFSETSCLWMLPCMTNELEGSLTRRGISKVQQLLDLPKATLQALINNFPASRLYQVWIALWYFARFFFSIFFHTFLEHEIIFISALMWKKVILHSFNSIRMEHVSKFHQKHLQWFWDKFYFWGWSFKGAWEWFQSLHSWHCMIL